MTGFQRILSLLAILSALLSLVLDALPVPSGIYANLWVCGFAALTLVSALRFRLPIPFLADGLLAALGAIGIVAYLAAGRPASAGFWLCLIAFWLIAWLFAERSSQAIGAGSAPKSIGFVVPAVFGITILVIWEAVTLGGGVPTILLPAPSGIWATLIANIPTLAADFVQTFLKAVLIGYALGCGIGFAVAILIDRSPFLKRGLLPLGNFVSALPLIGIAPIMVMWFGFDWPSKAAVVVVMTFFPMLVNTVSGLGASSLMERDLMRTYASSYWQTLFKLRLPAAGPFIFNALKINSTLALIGAIVAEFFGTPIVGMGFRISSEIGKLNVEMVWAEIAMAALAGSAFYGVVALVERWATFWHPSVRGGRA